MDVSDAARALPMGPRLEGITEQDLVTVLGRLITGAEDIAAAVADLSPDAAQRLYDLQDARKEEDEHKLTLLEFENEEAVRKRDMEDARAEFTKQLAEKSAGSATSGKKTKAAAACKGPPGGADRDMAGGGSSSMTGSGGLAKVRTSAGPAVPSAVVSKVKPYGGASTLPQFTAERRMSNPVTVSNASRIHSTSTGHRGAAVSSTSSTDSTHSPIDRHAMSASHAEGAKRASARSALSTARGHGPAEAEIPVGNRLPGLRTGGGTSRSTAAATGRSMYTNGSNASNTTSTNTTTTRTALAFPLTPVHRSQELYTPTTSSVPTTSPRLQRSGSGTSSSSSPSWMTTSTTSAVRAAHGPPKMNMKLSPIPRIATGGAGGLEGNPYGATPTHHPGSAGRGQREKGLRNHN
ncbi:uncharacterized protein EV422DRAFT_63630 [Fimicolochytrium jonesii]|uniref:uncharacterized protein n=1 Tax=Fimicolochytrium jonesii TaxID=1396493 RepID=UPI0022FDBC5F|nr:uncharacterized protein EV422DRAFT_63630 [Fimicolochytrium jonesii]KAI8820795.1 hypothetical protein EV422DRAFT_63630 [Fimicolochytrium jonesii]